jgi:hypothetical protein
VETGGRRRRKTATDDDNPKSSIKEKREDIRLGINKAPPSPSWS